MLGPKPELVSHISANNRSRDFGSNKTRPNPQSSGRCGIRVTGLQAFGRCHLAGCNPGDDVHVHKSGGVSQPGLAREFIQAKLGFRLASSALENGFVGPGSTPTSRATPASRAVKGKLATAFCPTMNCATWLRKTEQARPPGHQPAPFGTLLPWCDQAKSSALYRLRP